MLKSGLYAIMLTLLVGVVLGTNSYSWVRDDSTTLSDLNSLCSNDNIFLFDGGELRCQDKNELNLTKLSVVYFNSSVIDDWYINATRGNITSLDVQNITINDTLTINHVNITDGLEVYKSNKELLTINDNSDVLPPIFPVHYYVTINEGGGLTYFRVEGDNKNNLIYTDAANDRVGIGTETPDTLLHIEGAAHIDNDLIVDNDVNVTNDLEVGGSVNVSGNVNASGYVYGEYLVSNRNGYDVGFRADSYYTMSIRRKNGNLGILAVDTLQADSFRASNGMLLSLHPNNIFDGGVFSIKELDYTSDEVYYMYMLLQQADNDYTKAGWIGFGLNNTNPEHRIDVRDGNVSVEHAVKAQDFVSGQNNTGINDSTNYWLCTNIVCSATCQVSIESGLIVGCT